MKPFDQKWLIVLSKAVGISEEAIEQNIQEWYVNGQSPAQIEKAFVAMAKSNGITLIFSCHGGN